MHSIDEGLLTKNEMCGNVPIFHMRHAFRHHESWVDVLDFCRKSLNF